VPLQGNESEWAGGFARGETKEPASVLLREVGTVTEDPTMSWMSALRVSRRKCARGIKLRTHQELSEDKCCEINDRICGTRMCRGIVRSQDDTRGLLSSPLMYT